MTQFRYIHERCVADDQWPRVRPGYVSNLVPHGRADDVLAPRYRTCSACGEPIETYSAKLIRS
jgi:hypothetical protein